MRGRPTVIASVRARRGFTAVEISMVVTVIAILALLILPLFQRQTDEARITAAEGDIREFIITLQLSNANTGYWFALHDLDNTDIFDPGSTDPTLDVPVNTWNDTLTSIQYAAMADNWTGPYASFKRISSPNELENALPNTWFRGAFGTGNTDNGPIHLRVDSSVGLDGAVTPMDDERIPLDPWGSPYIFYGPDYYHLPNGAGGAVTETRFRNGLIVSLGPNSLPGDLTTINPALLARESGFVTTGDDLFRFF